MMNLWATTILLAILSVAQVTAGPALSAWDGYPHLVLIAVVVWTMLRGGLEGMRWALVGGILLGLVSEAPFGTHVLALCAVAFVVGLWQRTVSHATPLWPAIGVLVSTVLVDLVVMAVLVLHGQHVDAPLAFTTAVIPGAIVSAVLAVPGFYILRLLDTRFPVPMQPEW
ncbi:MAG: rod shape-determining protein MreD [Candidatus Dormibacteria bacterium]